MNGDIHDDVLSITEPFSALIQSHGMALSGLVLAHWVGVDALPTGRASSWFTTQDRLLVALNLLLSAPRVTPFFEAVSEEVDALDGATWMIDIVFDQERGDVLHAHALLELCIGYEGNQEGHITLDQSLKFLKTWRRNVRRQMLGSCIDWIEL